MEAIVLAGGFGTRLAGVVSDVPKPMAPVGGVPFLEIVLDYLERQKVTRAVLAVGYLHEVIISHFGYQYKSIDLTYSIEDDPLGTGGAIQEALEEASEDQVFVINGDTFFNVDLGAMMEAHLEHKSHFTIGLKALEKFDRYGSVQIGDNSRIQAFVEKQPQDEGLINGGIYLLSRDLLEDIELEMPFSFETEIMQAKVNEMEIYGFVSDGYFIDIGIPSDYQLAQTLHFDNLK